jgi:hypothetical protein
MEQVSALSNMNVSSHPASPRVAAADTAQSKEQDTDAASFASSSTITPDNAGTAVKDVEAGEGVKSATTPAGEIKTARERALAGLDKNNFETEVHQVMGTLNNWWGGVKKQVRQDVLEVRC